MIPRRFPYPLAQAFRDIQPVDKFYGQARNLSAGRKHAAAATVRRNAVLRVVKQMEGR